VASAYGTLKDLAAPLNRLEHARRIDAGLKSENTGKTDLDKLLQEVQSENVSTAKTAVSAVVERVIAGEQLVEVLPRF
jgi:hypothetical protein